MPLGLEFEPNDAGTAAHIKLGGSRVARIDQYGVGNNGYNFVQDVDPALDPENGVKALDTWAHLSAGLEKQRNVANDGWVITDYLAMSVDDRRWANMPLIIPFPVWDHIPGCPIPPTNNPNFRFIKLTASDAYNTGALTGESVSGSSPIITATAIVSVTGSPINGQAVPLINTERAFLRPGLSGVLQMAMVLDHWHRSLRVLSGVTLASDDTTYDIMSESGAVRNDVQTSTALVDGGIGTAGSDGRPRNRGASFYVRVK